MGRCSESGSDDWVAVREVNHRCGREPDGRMSYRLAAIKELRSQQAWACGP